MVPADDSICPVIAMTLSALPRFPSRQKISPASKLIYDTWMRPTLAPLRIFACLPLLAIAGCAQPFEGRIANRLNEAGLSRPMAECMAGRWVDRLSVFQLRKIQSLTEDLKRERSAGRLTVVRLIDRVRALDDPEIVEVVSTSAARCALKF